jgi:hypothetical protein
MSPAPGTIRKTRLSPCHQPTKVRAEAALRRRRPERSRGTTADHQMPIRNREIGFVLRIYPPAGPNWVRFARFALRGRDARPNWVRFARSAWRVRGGEAQSGRPAASLPPIHNREIGFVLHVSLPTEPRPTRGQPLPIYPSPSKFGFVLRGFLLLLLRRGEIGFVSHIYPPAGPNWVRFAHFASGARPHPASFNPQSPIRSCEIGFVLYVSPRAINRLSTADERR